MIGYNDSIFNYLVPSYFSVGVYEIVILQTPEGDALTIKASYNGE